MIPSIKLNEVVKKDYLSEEFELFEHPRDPSHDPNIKYGIQFTIDIDPRENDIVSSVGLEIRFHILNTELVSTYINELKSSHDRKVENLEKRIDYLEEQRDELIVYKNHYDIEYSLRHGDDA